MYYKNYETELLHKRQKSFLKELQSRVEKASIIGSAYEMSIEFSKIYFYILSNEFMVNDETEVSKNYLNLVTNGELSLVFGENAYNKESNSAASRWHKKDYKELSEEQKYNVRNRILIENQIDPRLDFLDNASPLVYLELKRTMGDKLFESLESDFLFRIEQSCFSKRGFVFLEVKEAITTLLETGRVDIKFGENMFKKSADYHAGIKFDKLYCDLNEAEAFELRVDFISIIDNELKWSVDAVKRGEKAFAWSVERAVD